MIDALRIYVGNLKTYRKKSIFFAILKTALRRTLVTSDIYIIIIWTYILNKLTLLLSPLSTLSLDKRKKYIYIYIYLCIYYFNIQHNLTLSFIPCHFSIPLSSNDNINAFT